MTTATATAITTATVRTAITTASNLETWIEECYELGSLEEIIESLAIATQQEDLIAYAATDDTGVATEIDEGWLMLVGVAEFEAKLNELTAETIANYCDDQEIEPYTGAIPTWEVDESEVKSIWAI